jgi:XTP/dITP diphosphohydrolase
MLKLVLATRNTGKVAEMRAKLKDYPVVVKYLADYPQIPEIEENGKTFRENAMIKAKTVVDWLNLPVLADDSGLEIDYLDGKPGIYSARWGHTDRERIDRVILALKNTTIEQRSARFVCAMSLVIPKQKRYVTTGTCSGRIVLSSRGNNGFGYDPIFIPEGYEHTFAQLGNGIKNSISHRAIALEKMIHIMVKHYQLK